MRADGASQDQIAKVLDIAQATVSKYLSRPLPPKSDKKVGSFNWREAIPAIEAMQSLKKKASWTQDYAAIELGDGKHPVILTTFCDQHVGAYGANHRLFEDLTDELIDTPYLYAALLGDPLEMAIKLRNVLEVTSQVLTPEMQEAYLESWLDEIQHKIAFAVWDNHAVTRQEAATGTSGVKNLLARRCVYHNGIGHSELKVGKEVYTCAASHKFRGSSMFNRTHAQGRYMRHEAGDRELVLMGDIHTWGISQLSEGGKERIYITGGSLHENSGYSKRYFSLVTAPYFPCVVLHHDRHEMVPFKTVKQALKYLS